MMAVATLVYKMPRIDVTYLGKVATCLLMFAVPGFLIGSSDESYAGLFQLAAWIVGIPGLILSYWTGIAYIPQVRRAIAAGGIRSSPKRSQPTREPRYGGTMNIPSELRYSTDHEWVRVEGATVTIGITEYAQDALGDVVFVEMPEPGAAVAAGETFSEVESTKSVSDIYAPVTRIDQRGQRRARVAARAAQQRPVRRGLDLSDRDDRPGRTRRPDGRRGVSSTDGGLTP